MMPLLPLKASSYTLAHVIGKGSFSKVYQAECQVEQQQQQQQQQQEVKEESKSHVERVQVAIKVMDLESVSTAFEDILQEVQTMKLSNHPNILQCHCSFVESNQLWLVMQLMDLGSCLRVMTLSNSLGNGMGFNEEWIGYILHETLEGLNYLHNNGQIHRDVKSGNILLDSNGNVRVADFGVSGWTIARGMRQETVKTFVGTPCYMAPEVMEQQQGYDSKADIWSIGITALELAKGYAPYAHLAPMRVLILTIEEEPPSLKSYPDDLQRTNNPFSSVFEDFYKKCLQKNPRNRPSAEELLRHKFLKSNDRAKEAFITTILSQIKQIGVEAASKSDSRAKLPGESSVAVTFEPWNYELNEEMDGTTNRPRNSSGKYVAGTTWVFDGDDIDDWRSSSHSNITTTNNNNNSNSNQNSRRESRSGSRSGVLERRMSDEGGHDRLSRERYKITIQGIDEANTGLHSSTSADVVVVGVAGAVNDEEDGDATLSRQVGVNMQSAMQQHNKSQAEQRQQIQQQQQQVHFAQNGNNIEEFLSDFEKEIVHSTPSRSGNTILPTPAAVVAAADVTNPQSTESFMDELEELLGDGK